MAESKPTMKSIARELGVSRSTVSFVLSGGAEEHRIHPDTARKIIERARELNFKPDYFARALNTRKTGAIGVVFPDVHESYMSEMVRGIDEVFACHDALMMLCSSRFDRALEMRNIESLCYRGIDGLIIVPCSDFCNRPADLPPLNKVLTGKSIPVVCADRIPMGWKGDAVVQDDSLASFQAVEHLLDRGATKVACISFDLDASSIKDRIAGYQSAMASRGLAVDPRWLVLLERVDANSSDLSDALRGLMSLPEAERPDSWFVTTTGLSYRARDLLLDLRPGVAEPPAIARFGTDPPHFSSTMIGLAQPHQAIGRRAAQLLFSRMTNPRSPQVREVIPVMRCFKVDGHASKDGRGLS
jgi:LacI family transcriptional regulator